MKCLMPALQQADFGIHVVLVGLYSGLTKEYGRCEMLQLRRDLHSATRRRGVVIELRTSYRLSTPESPDRVSDSAAACTSF